jgi:hypothetical protein
MRRLLILLYCLLFPLAGPVWAWGDCFRHNHFHSEHEHQHGVAPDLKTHGDAEDVNAAPRFHCPEHWFESDLLAASAARSNTKPQDYRHLTVSHFDAILQVASLSVEKSSIQHSGKSPPYPFLIGPSPHLLLSVFRI